MSVNCAPGAVEMDLYLTDQAATYMTCRLNAGLPIEAGMDVGIVKVGELAVYEAISRELIFYIENALRNLRPDATAGRLGRDRVADYAPRKGLSIEEGERRLAQNLDYLTQVVLSPRSGAG